MSRLLRLALSPRRQVWEVCLGLSIGLMAIANGVEARVNLPHRQWTLLLSAESHRSLYSALVDAPAGGPIALAPEVENLLLSHLPGELLLACVEMVRYWGSLAENRARWTAHGLYLAHAPERLLLLFAYRCGSTLEGHSRYYDERLAVLDVETSSAKLRLIPVAEECENCSELYQLGFSGRLPVQYGELVELVLVTSSDNPCCDGPVASSTEQLLYLLLPETKPILTVERARTHYFHDDVIGDREEICQASIHYRRDSAGHLNEILATTECRSNEEAQSTASEVYRWKPTLRQFDHRTATQP